MITTIYGPSRLLKAQIFDRGPDSCSYELWVKQGDIYRPLLRDLMLYTLEEATRKAELLLKDNEKRLITAVGKMRKELETGRAAKKGGRPKKKAAGK